VIGNNGLVYACDRANDRVNVYQRNGTFVRAIPVVPGTGNPGIGTAGSAWDVDFSPDKEQTFMYESDGGNEIMWIFDHRAALLGLPNAILGGFGRPGQHAGEFTFLHMMAIDSKRQSVRRRKRWAAGACRNSSNCGRDKDDDRGRSSTPAGVMIRGGH